MLQNRRSKKGSAKKIIVLDQLIYLEDQVSPCLNQISFRVFQGWKNRKILAFRDFFHQSHQSVLFKGRRGAYLRVEKYVQNPDKYLLRNFFQKQLMALMAPKIFVSDVSLSSEYASVSREVNVLQYKQIRNKTKILSNI